MRTWSFFCLWTCPSHWRILAPDWPCWNFSLNMLKQRTERQAQLEIFQKLLVPKNINHLDGSPWGRPQSAGPSLIRWGRWSVGNIFIPSILSSNLGSGIQRGSDCPTLLRDISVIQPVHTKAAPSPAEVATIHTQQVLSDKNTCNWIDSAGKPVESGTRVDSSKMVFC